jgi:hypothetical protein
VLTQPNQARSKPVNPPKLEEVFSPLLQQAAEFLGVTTRKLKDLCRQKRITHSRPDYRTIVSSGRIWTPGLSSTRCTNGLKRVFEKSHTGTIRFSIRRIAARLIIVSEVCTRYS